jgi:hypothetical protein
MSAQWQVYGKIIRMRQERTTLWERGEGRGEKAKIYSGNADFLCCDVLSFKVLTVSKKKLEY